MPRAAKTPTEQGIKTGRRENPTIDGPRDKTVCFMLSESEKLDLDRLAFCVNLTRSGLLAKIVAPFLGTTKGGQEGKEASLQLEACLSECRTAFQKRGKMAQEAVVNN
jgi:hypothetical protein